MVTNGVVKKQFPSIKLYDSLSSNPFFIDTKINTFKTYPTSPDSKPGVAFDNDGIQIDGVSEVKPDGEWKTRDVTEFTKVFSYEKIRHLGSPAQNIVYFIFDHLQKGKDYICLPVQIVLDYAGYSKDARITYYTGLKELLANKMLSPKTSTIKHEYWINPNIFFKGDRVPFFEQQKKNW